MPKFAITSDEQITAIPGSSFQYSSVKPSILEATEYTLVSIIRDKSGSLDGFRKELLDMTKTIIKACQKDPRSENLMVRVLDFDTHLEEIHGFRTLADINPDDYEEPETSGCTALMDATYSGIGATLSYAEQLHQKKMEVNGAVYIITDGMDNSSSTSAKMIAELVAKSKHNEEIESLTTVLIGMDTGGASCKTYLESFQKEANLDQFVWMGEATAGKLAKLAGFISKSISSQSQSLNTKQSAPITAFVI